MKGFTLGFQIDLIFACNLKCNFCAWNDNSDSWRNGERLSFEKLKNVFDTLYENPPDIPLERVGFVGSGEPLLYKQLPEAVSYAKRIFSHVGITTNGVLLTKEVSQKLIDAGANEIIISITGASPEVYAHHQGSGKTFDEVVRQI